MACLSVPLTPTQAGEIFSVELSDDFVLEVLDLFPEKQEIDPEWISYDVNPNIYLYQEASVIVTFIDEGAGYQNTFGYFLFEDADENGLISEDEIYEEGVIFENSSKFGSGGDLVLGDSVKVGPFPAHTHIGFYLVADGYTDEPKETYYTVDELNPDGDRHLAMVGLSDYENIALGIEDLPLATGDRDFNDVLFTFTTDPKEAILEIIEDNNIPVPSEDPDYLPPAEDPMGESDISQNNKVESLPSSLDEGPSGDAGVNTPATTWLLEGSGAGCTLIASSANSFAWITWLVMILGMAGWQYLKAKE